jgi:hypothetical protein
MDTAERYSLYKGMRKSGCSGRAIARELGISPNSIYKYDHKFELEIGHEEFSKLMSKQQIACRAAKERDKSNPKFVSPFDSTSYQLFRSKEEVTRLQALVDIKKPVLFFEDSKTTSKGHAAVLFFRYQLTRRGFKYLIPEEQSEGLDLVVCGLSGKFWRCEVKGYLDRKLSQLRHNTNTRSNFKSLPYTLDSKIDFFIVVDLNIELLAIIPFELVKHTSIQLTVGSFGWDFIDRYDLFI